MSVVVKWKADGEYLASAYVGPLGQRVEWTSDRSHAKRFESRAEFRDWTRKVGLAQKAELPWWWDQIRYARLVSKRRAKPAVVESSEPTARDAVAGMLLRHGYVDLARNVADGEHGRALAMLRSFIGAGFGEQRAIGTCAAALEALARGDLRGPTDEQIRAVIDLGDSAYARGVEEGERRAKAKADGLVTTWKRREARAMAERIPLDSSNVLWQKLLTEEAHLARCAREVGSAFGFRVEPTDGQPPTGGEPAPEEVVGDRAATGHVESAPYAERPRLDAGQTWRDRGGFDVMMRRREDISAGFDLDGVFASGAFVQFRTGERAPDGWTLVGPAEDDERASHGFSAERTEALVKAMLDHADKLRAETHRGGLSDGSDDAYPNGYEQAAKDVARAAGIDMGTGPARFYASVLVRAPDGEIKPLATFEGDDAEQRAREFVATLPVEPAEDDERWRPGARWEHNGADLSPVAFEVARCDTASRVWLRGSLSRTMVQPLYRGDMVAVNGWRYVGGPASAGCTGYHQDCEPCDLCASTATEAP